jgi:hypothetical protein
MKKHHKIKIALATATTSLLGVTANVHAEHSPDIGDWDVDAAILYYTETDRVSVIEPVISATKQLDTDETLSLKLVLDSLTGSSANGAVQAKTAQTFTQPSGNGSFTTAAGETPLDDTFQDTRVALSASWDMPLSRRDRLILGGNISAEYDYTSIGASSVYTHDLVGRNTTLSAGIAVASDTIEPEGNIPIPFGVMQPAGQAQPRGSSSDTKTTFDILLGATQIINKNSLIQFNYSYSQADGYLTDPFKVISIVDPITGAPIIEDTATNLSQVVYENRPDSRTKHSIFTQYKHFLTGDVFDISYRYMFDDWEIDSHTVDFRYRWKTSDTGFLRPHLRYYQQSEAEFFQPYYLENTQPGEGDSTSFATADYRLGEMTTYTIGLEYGHGYKDHGWSLAVEAYLQQPTEPSNKVGDLADLELAPDVDALMVRFNYDF